MPNIDLNQIFNEVKQDRPLDLINRWTELIIQSNPATTLLLAIIEMIIAEAHPPTEILLELMSITFECGRRYGRSELIQELSSTQTTKE